jgi:OTU domain-containing protein 6
LHDCEFGAEWGGQFEIQALSKSLKKQIHIIQALSKSLKKQIHIIQANSPLLKIGEEFLGEPLRISYHKHAFGLGEHYNSVCAIEMQ